MQIAILAHLKFPIGEPFAGGLERHTHLLATGLRASGHAVTLFAAEGSDPALQAIEVCAPTGEAVTAVEKERIERYELAAYGAIMDAVAGGGFDLVHNNSLHGLPPKLAGSLTAPMLTVLHTPPFSSLTDGIMAAGSATTLVAVSRSLAAQWKGLVTVSHVVGNGIDLSSFPFAPLPADPGRLFWSGRIVPEKGLHLAIEASRIAGIPIDIAGPRSNVSYWQDEIAPRLGEDAIYLGHLCQAELAASVGRSVVAVVTPRWEEPFGLVVAEALACGTPVAGFNRGALPEIVGQRCGALARPDDVVDLARAIRAALMIDRAACRRRAQKLFDAGAMIRTYETIYGYLSSRSTANADATLTSPTFSKCLYDIENEAFPA